MIIMGAFGAVLICDDVRRDTNNKDIIIGVYSADIVISSVPNWLSISLYLEYMPSEMGEQEMTIRFGMDDAGLMGADIKFSVDSLTAVALPLTGIQMLVQKEAEFLIEVSFDDKKTWRELKRKKIRVGPLPTAIPLPSLTGRAASNP